MTLKEYNERKIIGETIYLNDNIAIEWVALTQEPKFITAIITYMDDYKKLQITEMLQVEAELFEQESKELLLISDDKKFVAALHRDKDGERRLYTLYDIESYDIAPQVENDFRGLLFRESFPNLYLKNNYKVHEKKPDIS